MGKKCRKTEPDYVMGERLTARQESGLSEEIRRNRDKLESHTWLLMETPGCIFASPGHSSLLGKS